MSNSNCRQFAFLRNLESDPETDLWSVSVTVAEQCPTYVTYVDHFTSDYVFLSSDSAKKAGIAACTAFEINGIMPNLNSLK